MSFPNFEKQQDALLSFRSSGCWPQPGVPSSGELEGEAKTWHHYGVIPDTAGQLPLTHSHCTQDAPRFPSFDLYHSGKSLLYMIAQSQPRHGGGNQAFQGLKANPRSIQEFRGVARTTYWAGIPGLSGHQEIPTRHRGPMSTQSASRRQSSTVAPGRVSGGALTVPRIPQLSVGAMQEVPVVGI